mgnify:CR=1 FL=1
MQIAETLEAVHTHTHTCILLNNKTINIIYKYLKLLSRQRVYKHKIILYKI